MLSFFFFLVEHTKINPENKPFITNEIIINSFLESQLLTKEQANEINFKSNLTRFLKWIYKNDLQIIKVETLTGIKTGYNINISKRKIKEIEIKEL